jgi:hypothetical protein
MLRRLSLVILNFYILAPTSSETSSGSAVLVTTISVVVGAILLALLAAWIIHTLIKSRREKKDNDRLAGDEDLDDMFASPMMVNTFSSRNSLYDAGVAVDYQRQAPDMDNRILSRAPDSEDVGIPESRLKSQRDLSAVEGVAIAGAAIAGAELARQGTIGSNSSTPLIQSGAGANFVRVCFSHLILGC